MGRGASRGGCQHPLLPPSSSTPWRSSPASPSGTAASWPRCCPWRCTASSSIPDRHREDAARRPGCPLRAEEPQAHATQVGLGLTGPGSRGAGSAQPCPGVGGAGKPWEAGWVRSRWWGSRWAPGTKGGQAEQLCPPATACLSLDTGWPCSSPSDPGPAPCRTETMVEKLLTNWVSICLYTFLRVRAPLPSRHSGAAASGLTDLRPHSAQGPRARGRGVGEGKATNICPAGCEAEAAGIACRPSSLRAAGRPSLPAPPTAPQLTPALPGGCRR